MKIEIEIEEDCLDSLFEEIKQNGYTRRQFIEYFTFSCKREKLLAIKELSEMEISGLKDFLESKNLKLVRRK